VALDFLFADTAAMQIILNPRQFDVILTDNLFGDILSDEASVMRRLYWVICIFGTSNVLFEPIHGSYPKAKVKYSESYRFHFIGDVTGAFWTS
jgi:3-isopropylmalate dehydrogenase